MILPGSQMKEHSKIFQSVRRIIGAKNERDTRVHLYGGYYDEKSIPGSDGLRR